MIEVIVLVGIIALMFFLMWLNGKVSSDAKMDRKCVSVKSDDIFYEVRMLLNDQGIRFSSFLSSPSQDTYRPAQELWIMKDDYEKAAESLKAKYRTEQTPTALLVWEKK